MTELQQLIANLRDMGWTDIEIAQECGTSRSAVWRWRAGERVPRPMKPVLLMLRRLVAHL